jgi:phosphoribosylformimino-5-aminoimidazole carboxamide ribotide isomerase
VRLEQGDFARETVFEGDPVAVARRWEGEGARRLHVVDLDGAREGRPVSESLIGDIIRSVSIPVQVGGGIRDLEAINRYVDAGADRVALGTAAVEDQATLVNAVTLFRQRILVGVDARDGVVATDGWVRTSGATAEGLVRQLSELGVSRMNYTDIRRDGVLAGPNFEALAAILDLASSLPSPLAVIASGGVASLEHVRQLAGLGVEGVIIGKALYTGVLRLPQALAAAAA